MCRWLLLVGEFDERRGWADWGVYSCAHWLSWRCSIGLRAARENVRVAGCLRRLPLVSGAFAAGGLSYTQVRAITRVATAENEGYLVMLGRHCTGQQLEKIVSGYRGVLAATMDGAQSAHARRHLYWEYDHDGSLLIGGRIRRRRARWCSRRSSTPTASPRQNATPTPTPTPTPTRRGVLRTREREGCSAEHPRASLPARRADALVALARGELGGDPSSHRGCGSGRGDRACGCADARGRSDRRALRARPGAASGA